MKREIMNGEYVYNDEVIKFQFYTSLSPAEKVQFINAVVNAVVGDNYYPVIRSLVFDYMIVVLFTDIDTNTVVGEDNDIDTIEEFLNETSVANIVKVNIEDSVLEELNDAVSKNIEYHTGIKNNNIVESINKLINNIDDKIGSINTDDLLKVGQAFNNISGELTADKVLQAYINSDLIKK